MYLTKIIKPHNIDQISNSFDVSDILSFVNNVDETIWNEFDYRQKTFAVHKHTVSIPVLWVPLETNAHDVEFLSNIQTKHPNVYSGFMDRASNLLDLLENKFNGKVYKILLAKLKAQGNIPLHVDTSFSLEQTHRIHVPVITNELVEFTVDNTTINMKTGSLYEINNQLTHGVVNKSDQDRIHIIIDIIENQTIKEVKKSNRGNFIH